MTDSGAPASRTSGHPGWSVMEDDGFVGLVGPFWTRRTTDGQVHFGFEAVERHVNMLGVVQGGMLMTFGDRALGLAAWAAADGTPSVTVQFNTNFLAPAQIGSFIEVAPRVTRATRSLIFMEGRLCAGSTELATLQGIWKTVRHGQTPLSQGRN